MNLLEVKNICKTYGSGETAVKALKDVSFSVPKGEYVAVVGESGSGKSTLARTILALTPSTSGQVFYQGEDITDFKVSAGEKRRLRSEIQMIFQDPYASLNPFFTVGEIIAEGLELHKLCANAKERRERVYELLNMVGLSKEHANRFPHEFSGGQRQRVGIARALALNPEFIVCDEPISALDVSIQAQVVNMLMKFQRELGLTYLFIAHDLSMVRHIADETAVMYLGTMVEYGPTEEVYGHPAHPYTQGLLSAVPVADPDYEKTHHRIPMEGEVPSPIDPKPGCRFCGRCPRATEQCRTQTPAPKDLSGGHFAACHHLD